MSVKVSPKYQVVIPQEIRSLAGITPGMEVNVLTKNGVIYVIPIKTLEETIRHLNGKFAPANLAGVREKKDRKL